jgi:dolichol-phosphate mannosyltransferase
MMTSVGRETPAFAPTLSLQERLLSQLSEKIKRLPGPILVLGASGFVGANLWRHLIAQRDDVYGTYFHSPAWRLEGFSPERVIQTDLLCESNLDELLKKVKPRVIFNCLSYGAYSFETQADRIYQTNFLLTEKLLRKLDPSHVAAYVHAGSSSEYGSNASAPTEDVTPLPNSDYAVSKIASSQLLEYYGKNKSLPCANLRLYSVFGPLEDSSRLIPNLIKEGTQGKYPPLVEPKVSRDFVYVDDVCEAFLDASLMLKKEFYGDSFNIGTGTKTTIQDAALAAKKVLKIPGEPVFQSMENRSWDLPDWYANPQKANRVLGWKAQTSFEDGLRLTSDWYKGLKDQDAYLKSSKRTSADESWSVSAIVACYKDGQAIPLMHQRLTSVFRKLGIDYEIIFINDNSPDDSEAAIAALSAKDPRTLGVSHSRNFGSQSAFRSGMEIATKNACVLLDGDLQDPPELIESFVDKWKEGFDVVYGRRVKRQGTLFMQIAYKLFYRLFVYFSYLPIPRDAGDFSLIDRRVVQAILQFPERDLFLRGIRAYVGFKQTGVDYIRPERQFGKTTNNFFKNVNWAKKGIFSYSFMPLSMLSFAGTILFFFGLALAVLQAVLRLLYPDMAPKGATTLILVVLFFGSINLFATAILGEYIAKIFEEVKKRPHYVRRSIIRGGEIHAYPQDAPDDSRHRS